MIHSSFILADATAQQVGIGLFVATGIMAFLWLGTQLIRAWFPKKAEKIPLPLPIQVTDKFATKDELQEVKHELRELEKALPETERRIIREVKEVGNGLCLKINEFGSGSYKGREKIWTEVNSLRERVAAAEKVTNQF